MNTRLMSAFVHRLTRGRPSIVTVTPRKPIRSGGDVVTASPYTLVGYLWHDAVSSAEQSGTWGGRPVTLGWSILIERGGQDLHGGDETGDKLAVPGYGTFQVLTTAPMTSEDRPGSVAITARLRKLD
jgi:hypothetical protein